MLDTAAFDTVAFDTVAAAAIVSPAAGLRIVASIISAISTMAAGRHTTVITGIIVVRLETPAAPARLLPKHRPLRPRRPQPANDLSDRRHFGGPDYQNSPGRLRISRFVPRSTTNQTPWFSFPKEGDLKCDTLALGATHQRTRVNREL